jgi:hypothetical protein
VESFGKKARAMADRKRPGSKAGERNGEWLPREHPPRGKRWALEEQLFGPTSTDGADEALVAILAGRLAEERAGLARLEVELAGRAQRVAELAQQLEWLSDQRAGAPPRGEADSVRPTVDPRPTQDELDRDLSIRRCEGFEVGSPSGTVGVVEGLRFGSNVERPDLLEIKVGKVRPRVIFVPVEQVERILLDEERIELRSDPVSDRQLLGGLITRLRAASW